MINVKLLPARWIQQYLTAHLYGPYIHSMFQFQKVVRWERVRREERAAVDVGSYEGQRHHSRRVTNRVSGEMVSRLCVEKHILSFSHETYLWPLTTFKFPFDVSRLCWKSHISRWAYFELDVHTDWGVDMRGQGQQTSVQGSLTLTNTSHIVFKKSKPNFIETTFPAITFQTHIIAKIRF